MAGFNGSGTYVRNYNWVNDKTNGINITASRFDTEDSGFATGLSTCICKDGQTTTSALIPFASGVSIPAGSASTPGLCVIGNTNSGVYQPATNQLGVTAGGTASALFTSTGINGTNIGATTPGTGNFTTLTATSIVGPISANAVGKVAITQPASGSTLTVADGKTLTANHTLTINGGDSAVLAIAASKTLTVSNTMTLAGGDSSVMTFPNSTDTVATLAATQTLTNKTLTSPTITTGALGSSTATTQSAGDNSTKVATTAYADNAAAGAGLTLIATVDQSTATTAVVFTSGITGFNKYILEFDNLIGTSASGPMQLEVSTNSGSSYLATGYSDGGGFVSSGTYNNSPAGGAYMDLVPSSTGHTNSSLNPSSGTIKFTSVGSGEQQFAIDGNMTVNTGGGDVRIKVVSHQYVTGAINAIRIRINGGANVLKGNFHLYGIKGT